MIRWMDVRHSVRLIRRAPAVSAAVITTVALGIGATTAMVSVINGLLLRPLPFGASDRLIAIETVDARPGSGDVRGMSSPADAEDWRRGAPSLAGLFYAWTNEATVIIAAEPAVRLRVAQVSTDVERVLAVRPVAGRFFHADEFGARHHVAMLSHDYWRTAFGGDSAVVGRQLDVDGAGVTIVGVLPPLDGALPDADAELWMPSTMAGADIERQRGSTFVHVVARLRPGATVATATSEIGLVTARLAGMFPDTNPGRQARVEPYLARLVGPITPMVLLLAATVGMVLLIACGNVAGILAAWAVARRQEFAVRAAIGGGGRRLTGHLITEALVMAGVGGVLGILLAPTLLRLLLALYPGQLPRAGSIALDPRVLLVAGALTLLAGLLSTLPLLHQATKRDQIHDLRNAGRGGPSLARRRGGAVLVIGQLALSVVLLAAATALVANYRQLATRTPGFDPTHLVAFSLAPSPVRYPNDASLLGYFEQAQQRIAEVPGVQRTGMSTILPYDDATFVDGLWPEGVAETHDNLVLSTIQGVSAGYIETIGVPLVRGRTIQSSDRSGGVPIIVLNAPLAERLFPGENAVGRRVRVGTGWVEVVGVVGAKRHRDLRADAPLEAYRPRSQTWFYDRAHWFVVRTSGPPAPVVAAIRATLAELDPTVAVARVGAIEDLVAGSIAPERFRGVLVGLLGLLAFLLTLLGIWGMVTHLVSGQTRDIGIRIALGDTPSGVRRRVVGGAVRVALVGIGIGLAGAVAAGGWLAEFLTAAPARDPRVLAAVAVSFVVVTAVAALGPAIRASRIDPVRAMRGE